MKDALGIGQQRNVTLKTALHRLSGEHCYCDRSQPMQESTEEQQEQHVLKTTRHRLADPHDPFRQLGAAPRVIALAT